MLRSRLSFAARFMFSLICVAATAQPGLAGAAEPLSKPKYDVIFEEDVAILMRDGTVLRGDVYRPDLLAVENSHYA